MDLPNQTPTPEPVAPQQVPAPSSMQTATAPVEQGSGQTKSRFKTDKRLLALIALVAMGGSSVAFAITMTILGPLHLDAGASNRFAYRTALPSATPMSITGATSYGELVLFGDALEDGWNNWSWSSTVNLNAQNAPESGSSHITWIADSGNAALFIQKSGSPIDTTGYTHLSFALRSTLPGDELAVNIYDERNTMISQRAYLADYGGNPTTGGYKTYQIPLVDLGAGSRLIKGFSILNMTGQARPAVYVDSVKLVNLPSSADFGPGVGR